jgi:hypothetical protein
VLDSGQFGAFSRLALRRTPLPPRGIDLALGLTQSALLALGLAQK